MAVYVRFNRRKLTTGYTMMIPFFPARVVIPAFLCVDRDVIIYYSMRRLDDILHKFSLIHQQQMRLVRPAEP